MTLYEDNCYLIYGDRKIPVMEIKNDVDNEQTEFIFNGTIGVTDKIVLDIAYVGMLVNDFFGLYSTFYHDKNFDKRYSIVSLAFPQAHRIVPCFNEPWMKAIWNVEITHPVGFTALSNALEKKTVYANIKNYKTTIFHPTPPMSAYLLAITISDYGYTSDYSDSGTLVRVFAPNHLLKETEYALEVAVDSLNRFEIVFGVNYSLPKLDLFPSNGFPPAFGALETWGLVIFQTRYLIGQRKNVKNVVIHEIAHQWFGNLVTMDWLSEYWLNEGFATWYDDYEPTEVNFHKDKEYIWYHSMGDDNETPIKNLQIGTTFNIIGEVSHSKSSAIVRMLWKVVGSWKFRRQISKYLTNNAFKSTNSTIFYSYLADSMPPGSPSISDFMDPWLEQVGIPAVIFKNVNETHYKMSQKRFDNGKLAILDKRLPTPKWNYTWYIPLWCLEKGWKKEKLIWLNPGETLYIHKNTTLSDGLWRKEYVK